MNQDVAKDALWRSGNLRYLLNAAQRKVYDLYRKDEADRSMGRIWYLNISRQFGKSYTMCVLALEECLRGKGRQCKYAAPTQKMARAIVFPQMEKILQDCPEDIRPEFRQQDGVYYFRHNGSRLTVAGTDSGNEDKLRGQQAHLAIVDEGGFMPNLFKVVQNVLLPQTTTTKGRLIIATTPPLSAGHYAVELAYNCKSRGAYAEFTLYENTLLSEEEKKEIIRECGGAESTAFRREYLCEFVTDTDNAVVPEFTQDAESEIVLDYGRPAFFDAYTTLDGGYKDASAALFCFVDYKQCKLVVEEEWTQTRALGSDIAKAIQATENALWASSPASWTDEFKRRQRVDARLTRTMDVDPMLAAEFLRNHGMHWNAIVKSEEHGSFKLAAVNQLNDFIKQRSIIINPKCTNLIRQMHNATWARSSDGGFKRTYTRNQRDGHFDLVDALVYTLRVIDLTHNPFPPDKVDHRGTFSPEDLEVFSEDDSEVLKAFGLKG